MKPISVGPISPRLQGIIGDNPDSANLSDLLEQLKQLVSRLAPRKFWNAVKFDGSATYAASKTGIVNLTSEYNGILVSLSAGTVNLYFSSGIGNQWDLQFSPSANPIYVPFPPRNDTQITWQVDAGSSSNARGAIHLIDY